MNDIAFPPRTKKKITNNIDFPEKPLQADISWIELQKKFPESQMLR